jgi:outer membrane protein, adhesin transport system
MLKCRVRDVCLRLLIAGLLCDAAVAHAGSLSDALQATLRNHPAVAGGEAQVEARRYAADGARSQRYPTLSAEARQFTESSRSAVEGDHLSRPALLRVRQPIWAFGRIDNSIAVADAQVDTQRADLKRVRRRLLEDTAVAYAVVRGGREQIDVAEQNVSEHMQLRAQIQRRVEGQLASNADALLAATRLAQARAVLEHAVSEWDVARQDLTGLTQVEVDADQPVPSDLLQLKAPADLIEMAMDQSAEIQLKQQQLGQADAEVDSARTYYMPTIYLQADKFYDQPGLRDDNQVSAVIEASLDGLGFAARGRTGEAVASRTAAEQDLAAAKVDLRREIERLQRSRTLQTELIELETQSLNDLESLLASYQRQYESGTKSWLDLLNMQRELFEQRRQLVQARNDWQIYSLQLLARTGGLDALAGIQEQRDG